jgi:prevent-host-death family protein
MSEQVNIYDAKTRLSQLVERAEAGEEIIIARAGRPAARLVPFRGEGAKRKPGRMRGRIRISRDFEAPLPSHLFDRDE